MTPAVRLSGIFKSFGSVAALTDVSLELFHGEVIGLLGDNGAGKSTLIKIISGVTRADSGQIQIKGRHVPLNTYTPAKARQYGIETVHQDRALGEKQPIWRNFFMGRHVTGPFGMIRKAHEKQETMGLLKDFLGLGGAGIDPDAPAGILSGGERQGLAIARAIYFDADIVILDEPCTALAVNEAAKVQTFIKRLKDKGKAVLLISHTLSQVWEVGDRFVCLNRGKTVDAINKSDISLPSLTQKLVALSA